MAVTLKLSADWDIQIDAFGDFLICKDKEQIAQDVASSVRVFRGEDCWDVDRGIPFKEEVVGTGQGGLLLQEYMKHEAKRINGVSDCSVLINTDNRTANVELLVETEDGELVNVV